MNRGVLLVLAIGGGGSGANLLLGQDLTVETGGLHARYADSVSGTAGHVGLRLELVSDRAAALFDAGLSHFTSGETVSQVVGRGSVFAASSPRFALGLQWGSEWNRLGSESWVGIGSLGPVIGFGNDVFMASIGGSVGGVRRLDGSTDVVGSAGLTVERQWSDAFSVQLSGTATVSDTLEFADFVAGFGVSRGGLQVSVTAGARAGDLSDDPWGQVRASYVLALWAELEGAVGSYPRDLMGFTDGMFVTLGLRVSIIGTTGRLSHAVSSHPPRLPVRIEPLPGGRRRIIVRYAGRVDQGIQIAGDWNGWTPIPLKPAGRNTWSADLRIEPGLHQYQLIVDDNTWTIPEGGPWVPDDLGGRVGLLVVR